MMLALLLDSLASLALLAAVVVGASVFVVMIVERTDQ